MRERETGKDGCYVAIEPTDNLAGVRVTHHGPFRRTHLWFSSDRKEDGSINPYESQLKEAFRILWSLDMEELV